MDSRMEVIGFSVTRIRVRRFPLHPRLAPPLLWRNARCIVRHSRRRTSLSPGQGTPSCGCPHPVVHRPEAGLSVLFTRRTAHLSNHGGQISFPGGRAEPDDGSPAATALRETEEEIGLARSHVEVLGTLSEYVTVTAYRVTPVVGLVTGLFELSPDGSEVAEVFEVPLAHLLDPTNHQRNTVLQNGWQREYYAVPYGEYYIWGATAGMVMNFYNFLRT